MGEWYFPPSGGGETQGLNEPGVEMFKETDSLARETVQNVLDNPDGSGKPRIVEFEMLDLPFSVFPDKGVFEQVFAACEQSMRTLSRAATPEEDQFFSLGKALLEAPNRTIPTLRIRDSRTTGLVGEDDEEDKPFCRLLRVQGVSTAQGPGGGTYGIGQRAPFHCSALRTLLYYTKTAQGGREAFIAKSILCTHKDPEPPHRKRQSKGWWCLPATDDPDNWRSARQPADLPEYFRRAEPGTDIYVTGFVLYEEWMPVIRDAVLRNFFAAVAAGQLEVTLKQNGRVLLVIDSSTLDSALAAAAEEQRTSNPDAFRKELGASLYYLRALRESANGAPFTKVINGIGELRLYVHRDARNADLPDAWGYMRKPFMLIGSHGASVLRRFAALLVCDNDIGNRFLSRLEGPQHREWKATEWRNATSSQLKEAERIDRAIKSFVRDSLRSLKPGADVVTLNPPLLGQYLPEEDDRDSAFDDAEGNAVEFSGTPTQRERANRAAPAPTSTRIGPRAAPANKSALTQGESGQDDGPGGAGTPTGEPNVADGGTGGGGPGDEEGLGAGDGERRTILDPRSIRSRSYVSGDGYILVVHASNQVVGDLRVVARGEGGTRQTIRILEALDESGRAYTAVGNAIRDLALDANTSMRLRVRLDVGARVCLEVGA